MAVNVTYEKSAVSQFFDELPKLLASYQLESRKMDYKIQANNLALYDDSIATLTQGINSSSSPGEISDAINSINTLSEQVLETRNINPHFFNMKKDVYDKSLNKMLNIATKRTAAEASLQDSRDQLQNVDLSKQTMTEMGAESILKSMRDVIEENSEYATSKELARFQETYEEAQGIVSLGQSMQWFDTDINLAGINLIGDEDTDPNFDFRRDELSGVKGNLMQAIDQFKFGNYAESSKTYGKALSSYNTFLNIPLDVYRQEQLAGVGAENTTMSQLLSSYSSDFGSLSDIGQQIRWKDKEDKDAFVMRHMSNVDLFNLNINMTSLSAGTVSNYKDRFKNTIMSILDKQSQGWLSDKMKEKDFDFDSFLLSEEWEKGLYGTEIEQDAFRKGLDFVGWGKEDEELSGFQALRWVDEMYNKIRNYEFDLKRGFISSDDQDSFPGNREKEALKVLEAMETTEAGIAFTEGQKMLEREFGEEIPIGDPKIKTDPNIKEEDIEEDTELTGNKILDTYEIKGNQIVDKNTGERLRRGVSGSTENIRYREVSKTLRKHSQAKLWKALGDLFTRDEEEIERVMASLKKRQKANKSLLASL